MLFRIQIPDRELLHRFDSSTPILRIFVQFFSENNSFFAKRTFSAKRYVFSQRIFSKIIPIFPNFVPELHIFTTISW